MRMHRRILCGSDAHGWSAVAKPMTRHPRLEYLVIPDFDPGSLQIRFRLLQVENIKFSEGDCTPTERHSA